MAAKSTVRFLTNTDLEVQTPTGKEVKSFIASKYYSVDKIVRYNDGYCDIYLEGGATVNGLDWKAIEPHGPWVVEESDKSSDGEVVEVPLVPATPEPEEAEDDGDDEGAVDGGLPWFRR